MILFENFRNAEQFGEQITHLYINANPESRTFSERHFTFSRQYVTLFNGGNSPVQNGFIDPFYGEKKINDGKKL